MLARQLYFLLKVRKQQWLNPDDLRRLQEEKLRAMIRHAFKYSPYYRRLWKSRGIDPEGIRTVDDLEKLPVLTKCEVVRHYNQFISLKYRELYRIGNVVVKSTSGSSGAPFRMIFDERAWDYLDAVYLRALMAAGYDPRKPLAYYWYEQFERKGHNRLGFMNKDYIPCTLSEEEQIAMLKKLNPKYVYYFSSILHSLSKRMSREGVNIDSKMVVTHAEVATKGMKKSVENAFGVRPLDQYGMNEFNRIAWECPEEAGYHVDADSLALEVLDQKGEMGRAVITGLTNFTLPLIRYDTGDTVSTLEDTCPCGRSLPLIKGVEGRTTKLIHLKSGRIITPRALIDAMVRIPAVQNFKAVYKGRNRFRIEVAAFDEGDRTIKTVENRLSRLAGEPIAARIKFVDVIRTETRGKTNLVSVA